MTDTSKYLDEKSLGVHYVNVITWIRPAVNAEQQLAAKKIEITVHAQIIG